MTKAVEVLDACYRGDEGDLERLGWRPVFDALRAWWWRMPIDELAPYASALGDEDPERIVTAIHGLMPTDSRPSGNEIYKALHPPVVSPPGAPRGRPDLEPAALQAVRLAAAAGATVCDGHGRRTVDWCREAGVLRCPDCGGLEVGQYETAIESPESAE